MNTIKAKNEEVWTTIPGFENYKVSDIGRVCRNDGVIMKLHINKGYSLMRDGKQRYIRPPRLMYAALHNIDPMDIKGVVVVEKNGKLTPLTRSEYVEKVTNIKRSTTRKAEIDTMKFYSEVIAFSQAILRYYDSGDITEVANEINKYKEKMMIFMRMSLLSSCKDTMKEAWSEIMYRTLSGIEEKRLTIVSPHRYLKKAIRNYFYYLRKNSMNLARFDDSVYLGIK